MLGNMQEFHRDPLGFALSCARDYGDITRVRFLHKPAYYLSHPDHIEYVLSTNYRNFKKAFTLRIPFMRRLAGNGLLTSEGDSWLRQRRLVQPAFHRERTVSYGDVMIAYTERMLDTWYAGEVRDVQQEMMRLTLEIVVKTLFDRDMARESDDTRKVLEFIIKSFGDAGSVSWFLDNILPTPHNRRFRRAVNQLDKFLYGIIHERRASGRDQGDLLSMLLQAQDDDGAHMSNKQLRDETMTLFFAGHETSALALSWTWYLLAQNPEVEAKLLNELRDVLGGRSPRVTDLHALVYTERIIKESMRLYPPFWGIGREAIKECEVGGYRVPAGTQLFMFQWVVHRDPRYYDRPEEFIPDRWAGDFDKRLPRYAYFPFGGGPRMCIGSSFAMMETVLLLATIAQRFRLRLIPEHVVEPWAPFTLRSRNGIQVVLDKR